MSVMSLSELVISGWMDGCSVASFIREHASVLAETPFALVTMVDSDPDVSQMPWAAPHRNASQQTVGSSLLMPTTTLLEVVEEKEVLYGFDEVWFTVSPDPVRPQPGMLTAPRQLVESPLSSAEASTAAEMLLGLGDGSGLNFVAMDERLARRLGLAAS